MLPLCLPQTSCRFRDHGDISYTMITDVAVCIPADQAAHGF